MESVYRKANRSLALLRRGRPVLNDKGLATIYKSFVRSQLESPVAGGSSHCPRAPGPDPSQGRPHHGPHGRHQAAVSGAPARRRCAVRHAQAPKSQSSPAAPLARPCPYPCRPKSLRADARSTCSCRALHDQACVLAEQLRSKAHARLEHSRAAGPAPDLRATTLQEVHQSQHRPVLSLTLSLSLLLSPSGVTCLETE